MTACFVNRLPSGEMFILADTVVTNSQESKKQTIISTKDSIALIPENDTRNENVVGTTSAGQRYSPVSGKSLQFFSESDAKIGLINERIPFNSSGNKDTIFRFILHLMQFRKRIQTAEHLKHYCQRSLRSITSDQRPSDELTIVFAVSEPPNSEGRFVLVHLDSNSSNCDFINMDETKNETRAFGSGQKEVIKCHDDSLFFMKPEFLNERDVLVALLMARLTSSFAEPLKNPIGTHGFGGSFLGLSLINGEVIPPADHIHIFSDKDDIIRFATKVAYRKGKFIVIDFLRRRGIPLFLVDKVIDGTVSRTDVNALNLELRNISLPQAPYVFHTYYSKIRNAYSTIIGGNGSGNAFVPPTHFPDDPSFDRDHWFGTGMDLKMELDGEMRTFKTVVYQNR